MPIQINLKVDHLGHIHLSCFINVKPEEVAFVELSAKLPLETNMILSFHATVFIVILSIYLTINLMEYMQAILLGASSLFSIDLEVHTVEIISRV
mmetsp:Transcript_23524/g.47284  ORF Transcript_23524/g.47284 Transcript_23524/m.47284 type:complete len:95 (-) Transcript_23524:571-855(-)